LDERQEPKADNTQHPSEIVLRPVEVKDGYTDTTQYAEKEGWISASLWEWREGKGGDSRDRSDCQRQLQHVDTGLGRAVALDSLEIHRKVVCFKMK
jgi:hypothetical protein